MFFFIFICSLKMWLNSIKLRTTGKQLCWKWLFRLCRWPLQGSSCSSFEIIPASTSSVVPVSSGIFSCPLHSQLPPRPRCSDPLKSRSNILCQPFLMLLHWWRVPCSCTNKAQEPFAPFSCSDSQSFSVC